MLKIRLRRMGAKFQPHYRVVEAYSRKNPDSARVQGAAQSAAAAAAETADQA